MSKEKTQMKLKTKMKIEKYPKGATKEAIDNGDIDPIEVIVVDDEFDKEEKEIKSIFGKEKVSK